MRTIETYLLPESQNPQKLVKEVLAVFPVDRKYSVRTRQAFFDTFDWRLFRSGLGLYRDEKSYFLQKLKDREPIASIPWQKKTQPKFWRQFPLSALRDKLRPIVDIRALLCMMKVDRYTQILEIHSEDQNAISRLYIEKMILTPKTIIHLALAQSSDDHLKRFLLERGLFFQSDDPVSIGLKRLGRQPGEYTTKTILQFRPDMPAHQAMKSILKYLHRVIMKNETGIKRNIDTEFLHDFRVSWRRTRSALSQIKNVLPADRSDYFNREFAKLGEYTNRLRDLDVYLLNEQRYRGFVAKSLQPGLDSFFKTLLAERKSELEKLTTMLNSPDYHSLMSEWIKFLNSIGPSAHPNANRPIKEIAGKVIRKRHSQIIKLGRKLNDRSGDENFHQLRIECKKLRYLLEFFDSLLPKKELDLLVKNLKRMQENLGNYNDYSMQQKFLMTFLNDRNPGSHLTAAAIGGMITHLYHLQLRERRSFNRSYKQFSVREENEMMKQLLE